jgi:hypothetical protein
MQHKPKNKQDFLQTLGKPLGEAILALRRPSQKRLPHSITFTDKKPSFALDDSGTLNAYAFEIATGKLLGEKYCGSNASIMNMSQYILGEGATAPDQCALVFIETMWNGRNMSWFVTVVSDNVTKQVG